MIARRLFRASIFLGALAGSAAWTGCDLNDKVAGGSSEVDNPIVVAFTSASGEPLEVTGSLSVYLSDQNPSVDPEPLLRKQLAGTGSVRLTGADFTQGVHLDSARAYNLLLLSGDSGTLLREVSFDPRTGRYASGSTRLTTVKLVPAPLVRYVSTLSGIDTGVVRVFVPGSPFQTVLVDSQFTFEAVPAGDLPFVAVLGNSAVPLKRDSTGNNGDGPRHHVDSTRPPREQPHPPSPDSLRASAGPDVTVYLAPGGQPAPLTLNGGISGVNPEDPRLAVLWKQTQDTLPRVQLTNRNKRQAQATFRESGVFRFVFSASYGPGKSEDTVVVWVQEAPTQLVFSAPSGGSTVYLDEPFQATWYSPTTDSLELQFRADSATGTWQGVSGKFAPKIGMNQRGWTPTGQPAPFAQLRLVNAAGAQQAVSPTFALSRRAPPPK